MADSEYKSKDDWTMRGESMTRIETFFAAACAFAVTMVVISVGAIPQTLEDLVLATKQIPAFAASFAIITWIWHTHSVWSRQFGLEDSKTVLISCLLILLILVYMYPLRLMMQGLFEVISDDFFPSQIIFQSDWEIRFMFTLFGSGFLLLSLTFMALWWHGLAAEVSPPLNNFERYHSQTELLAWGVTALVCFTAILLSVFLPQALIGWAGYSYFLLFPIRIGLEFFRLKRWRRKSDAGNSPPEKT